MEKWYIRKMRLNQGGYDASGSYWGLGLPLYKCWTNKGNIVPIRATDRQHAKEKLQNIFKGEKILTYR